MNNGIETPKISPKLLRIGLSVNPLAVTVDEIKVNPCTLFPAARADSNPAFILLTAVGELAEMVAPMIVDPFLTLWKITFLSVVFSTLEHVSWISFCKVFWIKIKVYKGISISEFTSLFLLEPHFLPFKV